MPFSKHRPEGIASLEAVNWSGDEVSLDGLTQGFGYTAAPLLEYAMVHLVPSVVVMSADVKQVPERLADVVAKTLRDIRIDKSYEIDSTVDIELVGPLDVRSFDLIGASSHDALVSDDVVVGHLEDGESLCVTAQIGPGRGAGLAWPDELGDVGHINRGPVSTMSYRVGSTISSTGGMDDRVVFDIRSKETMSSGSSPVSVAAEIVSDMLSGLFDGTSEADTND